jgi:perosamine synthetase
MKNKNKEIKIPYRKNFDSNSLKNIKKVFLRANTIKQDFGYQDFFEKKYTDKFLSFYNKTGYADAVNSGSSALWVAIKSLNIKNNKNNTALISPITNPGGVMPIILLNFKIRIIDSEKNNININTENFIKSICKNTKLAVITHAAGYPVDLRKIKKICKEKKISLIEDCSQAHLTSFKGKLTGSSGDVAIFSTMYRKTISTGGCGGLVYTKSKTIFKNILAHADRGKDYLNKRFNQKDVDKFMFPALNLNLDELSCSVGLASLNKIKKINLKRIKIVNKITNALKNSNFFSIIKISKDVKPSYYYLPIILKQSAKLNKKKLNKFLISRGISFNAYFKEVCYEWPWLRKYLRGQFKTKNAIRFRDNSINLYLHENYNKENIDIIINSLKEFENIYLKK